MAPTILHTFHLQMPPNLEPVAAAGPDTESRWLPVDEVMLLLEGQRFRPGDDMALMSFFVRHQIVTAQNSDPQDFFELSQRLAREPLVQFEVDAAQVDC